MRADAACIATAYRDRTAALKQVKHAGWKTYRDPALGISFEYLGNRQIKSPALKSVATGASRSSAAT